jgi:hypothetical protein
MAMKSIHIYIFNIKSDNPNKDYGKCRNEPFCEIKWGN